MNGSNGKVLRNFQNSQKFFVDWKSIFFSQLTSLSSLLWSRIGLWACNEGIHALGYREGKGPRWMVVSQLTLF